MSHADLSKEWFSAAEIAEMALAGMPTKRTGVADRARRLRWDRTDKARRRAGRGGGLEYHYSLLPDEAQAQIFERFGPTTPSKIQEWQMKIDWFVRLPAQRRLVAVHRLQIVKRHDELTTAGIKIVAALEQCEREFGIPKSTVRGWLNLVRGVRAEVWVAYLVPKNRGPQRADHE